MHQQEPDGITDQIGGGEIAADQQSLQIVGYFAFIERRPLRLQRHHVADEVILWPHGALSHKRTHVAGKRVDRLYQSLGLFR